MNAAVVFFSYQGNTRRFASVIGECLDASVIELSTVRRRHSVGERSRYIWGGDQIMMSNLPQITHEDYDFSAADLIVVGTPVWGGTMAPPVRSFLTSREFFRTNFALFTTYAGRCGSALRDMEDLLVGNTILDTLLLREPNSMEEDTTLARAQQWGLDLRTTMEDPERKEASGE